MGTLKINVSLPKEMYKQARVLVDRGEYGSFSEMVRSGIRSEIDLQRQINPEFVKSIKAAEKGGYKEYDSGEDMIADLHKDLGEE
jgi:Arc/MetJ-type ribon-helix-helix transcriptional regulator